MILHTSGMLGTFLCQFAQHGPALTVIARLSLEKPETQPHTFVVFAGVEDIKVSSFRRACKHTALS